MVKKLNESSLFAAVLWKVMERCTVQIINLAVQIILARLLLPSEFGSLSIILVFYNLADLLVQKGFGSALIRKTELAKEDKDSAFLVSLLLALICCAILFLGAPYIGQWYNNKELVLPLKCIGFSLLFSPLYCVSNAILIRGMRFRSIFFRGLIASSLSGAIGIFMAVKGYGLWALVVQSISNQILLTVVMSISTRYYGGFDWSISSVRSIFSFGKNVLITEFILTVLESIRSLIIGKQYSAEDLAYYDRGQTYPATLMRAIYDTLFATLLPFFSKNTDRKDVLSDLFMKTLQVASIVLFPIFIGLAAVSDDVIILLLTEKWKTAVPYMQLFCIYQAVFVYQIVSKCMLYAIGDSKICLKIETYKSFISLVLLVVSLNIGTLFIAASLILERIISDIFYVTALKKRIENVRVLKNTWKPLLCSAVMYLSVISLNVFKINNAILLVIKILFGMLVYFVLMIILDGKAIKNVFSYVRDVGFLK